LTEPAKSPTPPDRSSAPASSPRGPGEVPRIRRIVFRVLRILVGTYVALLIISWGFQSKLIYVPRKGMEASPADIGLPYDEVFFDASDGVRLCGWFIPAKDARATVLYCHGNAENISDGLDPVEILHRLRLNVFVFDYRGYGKSQGKPTEPGTYLDVEAAWRYLTETRKVPPESLIVHGRSLGGAIAAHLAKLHSPRALILESTFTSIPDRGAEMFPILPIRKICTFQYNTLEILPTLHCPILVIHSSEDNLIPISHGRKLFAAAKEPKQFLEIRGDHNTGFVSSGTLYTDGLAAFISRVTAAP
jgi:hypothetical protein